MPGWASVHAAVTSNIVVHHQHLPHRHLVTMVRPNNNTARRLLTPSRSASFPLLSTPRSSSAPSPPRCVPNLQPPPARVQLTTGHQPPRDRHPRCVPLRPYLGCPDCRGWQRERAPGASGEGALHPTAVSAASPTAARTPHHCQQEQQLTYSGTRHRPSCARPCSATTLASVFLSGKRWRSRLRPR